PVRCLRVHEQVLRHEVVRRHQGISQLVGGDGDVATHDEVCLGVHHVGTDLLHDAAARRTGRPRHRHPVPLVEGPPVGDHPMHGHIDDHLGRPCPVRRRRRDVHTVATCHEPECQPLAEAGSPVHVRGVGVTGQQNSHRVFLSVSTLESCGFGSCGPGSYGECSPTGPATTAGRSWRARCASGWCRDSTTMPATATTAQASITTSTDGASRLPSPSRNAPISTATIGSTTVSPPITTSGAPDTNPCCNKYPAAG